MQYAGNNNRRASAHVYHVYGCGTPKLSLEGSSCVRLQGARDAAGTSKIMSNTLRVKVVQNDSCSCVS